jgi:hypothetical protein
MLIAVRRHVYNWLTTTGYDLRWYGLALVLVFSAGCITLAKVARDSGDAFLAVTCRENGLPTVGRKVCQELRARECPNPTAVGLAICAPYLAPTVPQLGHVVPPVL